MQSFVEWIEEQKNKRPMYMSKEAAIKLFEDAGYDVQEIGKTIQASKGDGLVTLWIEEDIGQEMVKAAWTHSVRNKSVLLFCRPKPKNMKGGLKFRDIPFDKEQLFCPDRVIRVKQFDGTFVEIFAIEFFDRIAEIGKDVVKQLSPWIFNEHQ